MYRQGDVLLIEVPALPPRTKVVKSGVVLRGESTGHAHRILGGSVLVGADPSAMFVVAEEGTRLVHDEHAPIRLPAGNYQVIRQRELVDPRRNIAGSVWD